MCFKQNLSLSESHDALAQLQVRMTAQLQAQMTAMQSEQQKQIVALRRQQEQQMAEAKRQVAAAQKEASQTKKQFKELQKGVKYQMKQNDEEATKTAQEEKANTIACAKQVNKNAKKRSTAPARLTAKVKPMTKKQKLSTKKVCFWA